MGAETMKMRLKNPSNKSEKSVVVQALVNTGSPHLFIPENIAVQLGFNAKTADIRLMTTAGGKTVMYPYVGPLEVIFGTRRCFCGALVFGEEVRVGQMLLNDLDLAFCSDQSSLETRPSHSEFPATIVK